MKLVTLEGFSLKKAGKKIKKSVPKNVQSLAKKASGAALKTGKILTPIISNTLPVKPAMISAVSKGMLDLSKGKSPNIKAIAKSAGISPEIIKAGAALINKPESARAIIASVKPANRAAVAEMAAQVLTNKNELTEKAVLKIEENENSFAQKLHDEGDIK